MSDETPRRRQPERRRWSDDRLDDQQEVIGAQGRRLETVESEVDQLKTIVLPLFRQREGWTSWIKAIGVAITPIIVAVITGYFMLKAAGIR